MYFPLSKNGGKCTGFCSNFVWRMVIFVVKSWTNDSFLRLLGGVFSYWKWCWEIWRIWKESGSPSVRSQVTFFVQKNNASRISAFQNLVVAPGKFVRVWIPPSSDVFWMVRKLFMEKNKHHFLVLSSFLAETIHTKKNKNTHTHRTRTSPKRNRKKKKTTKLSDEVSLPSRTTQELKSMAADIITLQEAGGVWFFLVADIGLRMVRRGW